MISLQITEAKAKNLNELEDLAITTLRDALESKINADDSKVKIAANVFSVVGKNRQTATHNRGLEFGMATSIATSEQLKQYIKATSPQIQKALTGK